MAKENPKWYNMIRIHNDLFNAIRYMLDNPRFGESQPDGQYDIWLCWDEQDRMYTIRVVAFQVDPKDAKPVKRIGGWVPNTTDPGSMYLHMLEYIRKRLELDSLLPPRDQEHLEDHPYSMNYIR